MSFSPPSGAPPNASLLYDLLPSCAISLLSRFQASAAICMMLQQHTTGSRFLRRVAMPRFAVIPAGSWPRRMPAAVAAGYCGEPTVEAFLKRVGTEYPRPRVKEGRRQLWLRDDLDRAIAPDIVPGDLAEDL